MGLETILTVGSLAASGALAYVSQHNAKKRSKSPIQDDRPPTLSARGTRIPVVIGRRKIAPVFTYMSKPSNGTARVMHVLALGPGRAIRRVYIDSKPIAIQGGPLVIPNNRLTLNNQTSNPPTALVHWGAQNQLEFNALTQDLGINSKWPFHIIVLWENMTVSGGIVPTIDYELEVVPYGANRHAIPGVSFEEEQYVDTKTFNTYNPPNEVNRVLVSTANSGGFQEVDWPIGARVKLFDGGNTLLETKRIAKLGSVQNGNEQDVYVYFDSDINNTTRLNHAKITTSKVSVVGGADPVHALGQLLFALPPHGLGMDYSKWNTRAFEYAQELLKRNGSQQSKGYAANILIDSDNSISAAIGLLLQDMGLGISWNPKGGNEFTGLFELSQLYPPDEQVPPRTSVPLITKDHLLNDEEPELDTAHALPNLPTRFSITYKEQERNYRDVPLTEDSFGRILEGEIENTQKVPLYSVTDATTAQRVAKRRFPEALAKPGIIGLQGKHDTRLLVPGQNVAVSGHESLFRILSVRPDLKSDSCDVELMLDPFGTEVSSALSPQILGGNSLNLAVSEDVYFAFVETEQADYYWIPRVPSNPESRKAKIYYSDYPTASPSSTYVYVGESEFAQTGGTMTSTLGSGATSGGTFQYNWNLLDVVLDLSGDAEAWDRGDQLLLVGDELMFLEAVTINEDGTATFEGLVRPNPVAHSIGERVLIWPSNTKKFYLPASQSLVAANYTQAVKACPYNSSSAMSLNQIVAETIDRTP